MRIVAVSSIIRHNSISHVPIMAVPELALPFAFDDRTRLYAIRIAGRSDSEFQVVGFSGREALSDLYEYRVDLVATDPAVSLPELEGRQAALSITLADGQNLTRSGYVRAAEFLGNDGGLSAYRVTLVPWIWLATQTRHNRVFQDKTVLQILEEVLAGFSPRLQWRATPDVDRLLADIRPRSYCVQYRESDYAFLSRLLAEEGLGFCFAETAGADALNGNGEAEPTDVPAAASIGPAPLHSLVVFADSEGLPEDHSSLHQNGGRGIRYHRAASQEDQDAIQAFGATRRLQPAVTTFASFDYKAKSVLATSLATHREFAGQTLSGEASLLESYDYVGLYAFASPDEAEHYARIGREALEARFKSRFGLSSVRTLRPGFHFDLVASPLSDPEESRFLVTAVCHAGENNLPRETLDRAHRLFGADAQADTELLALAREHGYANRFEAIRADVPWRPLLADETGARPNPRPTAFGVQSAVVVGPGGESSPSGADELYTDKLGRVKVRFHWQRAETDQDRCTCWLRVAQRMAGPGYGSQWLPRIGHEVLVGFLDNDIDRPIVLGSLYNGQGEAGTAPSPNGQARTSDTSLYGQAGDHRPSAQANLAAGTSPAWHAAAPGDEAHRHAGALSGFKTKEFGGSGTNQLVFDDSDGQLRTQMATSHAATQLNLGHLIHQSDNFRGSFRGSGFELRSDAYGALRGGNGVFCSSYANPASGPAGDAAPAIALAKASASLAQSFSGAAGTHKTVKLSGHEGTQKAKASVLDEAASPLPALVKTFSGMVEGKAFDEAQADAGKKNTATAKKLPHTSDAVIGVAAKAGLSLTSAEAQCWANGEDVTWSCGADMSLAVAQSLRVHSGQAIGLLAGAIGAGEGSAGTGLTLIAAQGKVEMQAQADTLSIQAKDEVNVQSANASVDFAAAKAIRLKVAGGACIEIAGGNITVKCPGTITVNASSKAFSGPSSISREMNSWPTTRFDKDVVLKLHTGEPAANRKFEIHREDGAILHGVTDGAGKTGVQQSQLIGQYEVVIVE